MTTAGLSSTPTCWPTTPRHSARPYSRHLGAKVRELRFHLQRQQVRITYWLGPGKRVILLTMFYKTQRSEVAEVERAFIAQKDCEAGHGHAENVYNREISDE